jgi:hypothetical protein
MPNEDSANKNFLKEKLPYTWQLLVSWGYGLEGSTGHRIRTAILLLHSKLLIKRTSSRVSCLKSFSELMRLFV